MLEPKYDGKGLLILGLRAVMPNPEKIIKFSYEFSDENGFRYGAYKITRSWSKY